MGHQLIGVTVLMCYVALWWLAIRALFGRVFGMLEWIPVVIAAFAIPMALADAAVMEWQCSEGPLLLGWLGVAVAIDIGWLVRRFRRPRVNLIPNS